LKILRKEERGGVDVLELSFDDIRRDEPGSSRELDVFKCPITF
jgi:hypothetical protein